MKISAKRSTQAGFSLVELVVSIVILVVIMAAVFQQIGVVQRKTQNEGLKLDLTQESRDFVDQFARDLHMSGYPTPKIYQNGGGRTDPNIALGVVLATPTSLRLEGDIYGDGKVYSVLYQYFQTDPTDVNCPCLRRSVQQKVGGADVVYATGDPALAGAPGQAPSVYYTEVQNLIDPNGMTQGLFTYFQADGTQVDVGTGINLDNDPGNKIQLIDAIKVNLSTRAGQFDQDTGVRSIVNSISTIAELEN